MWDDENLIKILRDGGVTVMPTDTVYGIVGSAGNKDTVERIYKIRKRSQEKPCIILIGDINELGKFSIKFSPAQKEKINEYWNGDGAVSIIFDCVDDEFSYLHRGTKTLAFRLPALAPLRDLLLKTGPLVAPSANTEEVPPASPAQNIAEAKKYFGESVDLYVDGGTITGRASKVVRLHKDGTATILRE